MSLNGRVGHDYAGGHALLIGAGGVLLAEHGALVRYTADGSSSVRACYGGAPAAAKALAGRKRAGEAKRPPRVTFAWPRRDDDQADRAIGCLFGQVIGDSLGSLVEFRTAKEIAKRYPEGVRNLADGGTWNTLAGQPTDDSELALALARSIVADHGYDEEAATTAYARWYSSGPFDIGNTTARALSAAAAASTAKARAARAAADASSQANGSLMRVSPIGILAPDPATAATAAARDSALTHPHPTCVTACAAFAAAISAGIAGASPHGMWEVAFATVRGQADAAPVLQRLEAAARGEFPQVSPNNQGWVLVAFQAAFRQLLHSPDAEEALVEIVARGGDTDTNRAITGALLGAAHGRAAFPPRWITPVLACRPSRALGATHERPQEYWPDDLSALAEALLTARPLPEVFATTQRIGWA